MKYIIGLCLIAVAFALPAKANVPNGSPIYEIPVHNLTVQKKIQMLSQFAERLDLCAVGYMRSHPEYFHGIRRWIADAVESCPLEKAMLIREHDRLFGQDTGTSFFKIIYLPGLFARITVDVEEHPEEAPKKGAEQN